MKSATPDEMQIVLQKHIINDMFETTWWYESKMNPHKQQELEAWSEALNAILSM